MGFAKQLAEHLHEIYFGGNWTESNLTDQLSGITWSQATTKVDDLNTIATLTFHVSYYVTTLLKVLHGKPLSSKDSDSFNHPPIQSQKDWDQLLDKIRAEAKEAVTLIENLDDYKLDETFVDKKYGNYFRNILGIIEHMHYHLGQIVVIKKLLLTKNI